MVFPLGQSHLCSTKINSEVQSTLFPTTSHCKTKISLWNKRRNGEISHLYKIQTDSFLLCIWPRGPNTTVLQHLWLQLLTGHSAKPKQCSHWWKSHFQTMNCSHLLSSCSCEPQIVLLFSQKKNLTGKLEPQNCPSGKVKPSDRSKPEKPQSLSTSLPFLPRPEIREAHEPTARTRHFLTLRMGIEIRNLNTDKILQTTKTKNKYIFKNPKANILDQDCWMKQPFDFVV